MYLHTVHVTMFLVCSETSAIHAALFFPLQSGSLLMTLQSGSLLMTLQAGSLLMTLLSSVS